LWNCLVQNQDPESCYCVILWMNVAWSSHWALQVLYKFRYKVPMHFPRQVCGVSVEFCSRVGCELGLREPIRKLFTRVGHELQVRDLWTLLWMFMWTRGHVKRKKDTWYRTVALFTWAKYTVHQQQSSHGRWEVRQRWFVGRSFKSESGSAIAHSCGWRKISQQNSIGLGRWYSGNQQGWGDWWK
jgi:hypothetical protein